MSKAALMRLLRDERCSPAEIAAALDMPLGRVKQFLHADARPKFCGWRSRRSPIARAFRSWRGQPLGGVVVSL
ncbi:hypothetical protein KIP31_09985 [Xanthomonas campestris pv. campestris]|jgi:hypothetical protein|uniref:hypothetical protein n=1 Tax=Xanthomonas campestris TaxID=339 RepID=UPI001F31BE7A|nr:hypothetical protein [Xanthomonas campestris]MCF8809646.1 hypothetical protein [Xanthomonas campestris pv. campestris]MDM7674543.1 hypothetical protein [Xanthomonas campestris pv. campestris]